MNGVGVCVVTNKNHIYILKEHFNHPLLGDKKLDMIVDMVVEGVVDPE